MPSIQIHGNLVSISELGEPYTTPDTIATLLNSPYDYIIKRTRFALTKLAAQGYAQADQQQQASDLFLRITRPAFDSMSQDLGDAGRIIEQAFIAAENGIAYIKEKALNANKINIYPTNGGGDVIHSGHVDEVCGFDQGTTQTVIYHELRCANAFFNRHYIKISGVDGYEISKTGWSELADYLFENKQSADDLANRLDHITDAFEE